MTAIRLAPAAAALVLSAAGSACAPRAAQPPGAPVVVISDEREGRLSAALGRHVSVDDAPIVDDVAAPAARVHGALVAAYAKIGLPAAIVDSAGGVVAVPELRVDGRLAGDRASRYLSCGLAGMGARADLDRLMVTIVSRVSAGDSGTSRIATSVVGTATNVRGAGKRQACSTTGQLEARLHMETRTALGV